MANGNFSSGISRKSLKKSYLKAFGTMLDFHLIVQFLKLFDNSWSFNGHSWLHDGSEGNFPSDHPING